MALISFQDGRVLRFSNRLRGWLAGEHAIAQRMAATAFAIRVASAFVVFVSQIILARWMGSFEYGTYVYVWTWLLLLGDIVHLGLPLTAQRKIPEYNQDSTSNLLRGYLSASRWLTFALASGAAVIGAAAIYWFTPLLPAGAVVPLYWACAGLPFYALSFMLDGICRSQNWVVLGVAPHSLFRPVVLLAVLTGLHFAGVNVHATAAMIATVAAIWITALGQLLFLNWRLSRVIAPGPHVYDIKGVFAIALPLITVWGFYTALTTTDVLVLQQFRPANEVAHYYAASKILTLVTFVYFAVAASAAHRFAAYHIAGDQAGLADFTARTVRWIFWPSLAVTLLILAAGEPLLWLFGPNFTDAYPVLFVLAIGLLARAAVGPAERILTMVGQQRWCAYAYVIAFAVNLSGCLALAGPYGGMGVAAATSAAFVVESALLFVIARRTVGVHLLPVRFSC